MTLTYTPAAVELVVTDTRATNADEPGRPVDSLAWVGGGYGLVGMQERAELLGGCLAAGPTDHGWRVALRIHR